jgi:hypothetical protein
VTSAEDDFLGVGTSIVLKSATDVLNARITKLERLESGALLIIADGEDGKEYIITCDDSIGQIPVKIEDFSL